MALSDTFFKIASLEEADRRNKILEEERADEKDALQKTMKLKAFALQRLMAGDLMKRVQASGVPPDQIPAKVAAMLPAYQQAFSRSGLGDWGDATPDTVMSMAEPDEAELEARKTAMEEGARYGVRHQYGDTPIDKYKLEELSAQRGSLPQGYRFGQGGAERIPGLPEAMTPEKELELKLREKAAPTYQDLHPQAKQLDNSKQFDQRKQYSDLLSTIDTAIADAEDAYKLQQGTDRTGPILGGGGIITTLNKAAWGGEDIQRLEKAYNRQAASALAAFKALGMAGQLSDKEGEWVRSTEAQLSNDKEVNLETLSRGIALLKDRKSRISQLGSEFGLGDSGGVPQMPAGIRQIPAHWPRLPDGRVIGPDGKPYRIAQ